MGIILNNYDGVSVVTIDRQQVHNALNIALIEEISATISEVAALGSRALVFTGAGKKAFSAGADVAELQELDHEKRRTAVQFAQSVFAKLDELPIISIAAIHGFALGGGLELAMACTFRVATPGARFGLPESKLGLIPGYGGTQRLPRLVGAARATELIVSGRIIDVDEADRIGLVHSVSVETDPVEAGLRFAKRFAEASPNAGSLARKAIAAAMLNPLPVGLQIEATLVASAFDSADAAEGIAAFTEKRAPNFG